MRSIESEGDTIDQAIERALRALDVARDQVQIEILSDATRGLLGFGGKKARVRATVRPPLASRLLGLEHEAPGWIPGKPSRRRNTVSLGPPRPLNPLQREHLTPRWCRKPSSSSARAPSRLSSRA